MARKHWLIPVKHVLEALAAACLYSVVRLLPLDVASNLGGWLGQRIGPRLKAHQIARLNLQLVFPEYSQGAHQDLLRQMWDNLGRVLFEFPFLGRKRMSSRIEIVGAEHVQLARDSGKPIIYFSGHFGNWELSAKTAYLLGTPLTLIYRQANNKWTDKLTHYVRGKFYSGMYAKGQSAAIRAARALKEGHPVGMLMDQKMNDGISVPFMGYPAMTAHAIATMAVKYGAIVLPSRVIRKKGAHFKSIIYPPLIFEKSDDRDKDTYAAMVQINDILSSWVRENPEQWFWVHQRWGKPSEVAALIENRSPIHADSAV